METGNELKKTSRQNGFVKCYKWVISVLVRNKQIAFFLSHGGLHFLALIVCIIGAIFMYNAIQGYNQRTIRQFTMRIEGDTLNNYFLSHISLHHILKVDSDKGRSTFESINYHFKYGRRKAAKLKTSPYEIGPYGDCDVDVIQKVSFYIEDSSLVVSIPESDTGWTSPETRDKHHTSKIEGVDYHNKLYTTYYHYFTVDDTIKEDDFEYLEPNMINKWDDKNPYFSSFIGIHAVKGSYDLDSTSRIMIQYNFYPYKEGANSYKLDNDFFAEAPMTIEGVLPVPSEITLENIIYKGKDVEKVFEQGGIYITAVDPVKKAQADKMEFLLTVLLGTICAFALDIIVQLILKWRKLKS